MIDLPDGRSWSSESLELVRRMAVRAVLEQGKTRKEMAQIVGVSEHAVGHWCAAYQEHGEDSFAVDAPGRPSGAGRFLDPDEERAVRNHIVDTSPEDHEIESSAWTRSAVGRLISKLFDIDLSDQGVGNYLDRWGLTPQKPARHAREADPQEVQEFEEEILPKTLEEAKDEGGEVHFADETGVQVDDQIGRSYSPEGQTPVLEFPKTRIAQNMISSVTPEGDMCYWIYSGTMTAKRFIEWLESLSETTSKKIFLFIDSHPAHTANAVDNWVADHSDQLEITWLPRYSPEHNPDEFLNNDVKQNLTNEPLPNSTSKFRDTIQQIMDEISGSVERIKGYFQQSQLAPEWQE